MGMCDRDPIDLYFRFQEMSDVPTTLVLRDPRSPWTPEDDRRERHIAAWLRHCSRTHDNICHCHDWVSHVRKPPTPEKPPCTKDAATDTEEDEVAVTFDFGEDLEAVFAESIAGDTAEEAG